MQLIGIQGKGLVLDVRVLACLLMFTLASCGEALSPLVDLPSAEGVVPDPARLSRPPPDAPDRVGVSHILVSYRGAKDALRRIKTDRRQARLRAEHLLRLARGVGADFAELARKHSDDASTSMSGGDLGVVGRSELHPDLEAAAFGMEPGQVSEVVESPRGFHIFLRHQPTEFQAAEIVVTYTGALRYKPRTPRSREQAGELAEQIHLRLLQGGSFHEEAFLHSDLSNRDRGGVYQIFRQGSLQPQLEQIVFGLEENQISDVVETATGFHIVKRLPVQRLRVRQIRIDFQIAGQEDGSKRSLEEARRLAEEVREMALRPGQDFAELAARFSDAPDKNRGGLIDPLRRGTIGYRLEEAAFSLEIGEVSPVVQTPVGFHIVKRLR